MATAIQRRRGNTAQHASFTGLAGEITIDTDKNTVVVHDGVTAGGYPLARADEVEALGGADITAVIAGSGLTGGASSGNATISLNYENLAGNLVPSANNTYSLGAVNKVWKDVYVGPGSLYVNGQKVLEDNNGTIVVSADSGQNLSVVTSGGGDIELSAGATGDIQLKSNVILSAGKTITASGGLKLSSNLDVNSQYINNVTNPVQAQDAATKGYVDGATYLSAGDGISKSTGQFSVDNTVVRTSGTQTIAGTKTFSNDVTVSGNLTVSGTTITVNSETISLADNIIDLNSNFTTGSPSENAGIRIKRGDSADVQIRWNEADDKWQFTNDGSAYLDMLTSTQVKALFSATDAGGDGSFSYSDGVFTYTGPSAADVRAHLAGGAGLTYSSGTFAVGAGTGITVNADDVAVNAAYIKSLFSATDAGGDGSFSYSDGVFTYTGPSAADVRAHFSAGTGVTLSSGQISIGQAVGTTSNVTFNTVTAALVGNVTGTVSSLSNHDTADLAEGTNLYFTAARARGNISVTDAGGDGSLSYDSGTGVITYTGPSATEVRAHLAGGSGLTYTSGTFAVGAGDGITVNADDVAVNVSYIKSLFSASDAGGDGSFSYDNGVFTYTGPSATEVRAHLAGGAGLTYTTGSFAVGAGTGITVNADDVAVNAAYIKSLFSASDAGGDGSFGYSDGVFTYTGPSASEVRAHFSAGTGVTLSSGQISIGQAVGTTSNVTFNDVTVNGTLNSDDITATNITVAGNLTVTGTTTTVNTETINLADNKIVLNSNYTGSSPSEDGGIEIERGTQANKSLVWDETNDKWTVGSETFVAGTFEGNLTGNLTGNVTGTVTGTVSSLSNHDTADLAEGTNLYFTAARARGNISVTDSGGDGSLSYDSGTGVITYTGPSQAEANTRIDARLSGGTGITYTSGVIATTITQYTDTLARGAISVTDSGGDGSLSYNSGTGVITYTGPSQAEANTRIDARLSGGTGITYTGGVIATTITQYTDTLARGAISVTDAGGDGSLSYDSGTGVITYTGPSASDVRAHFSAGTGVTLSSGQISIGQAVGTTNNVTFNNVTASANFIGNLTGNVTGNLTGNAGTATALATARTIALSGDVTGSATFDGSANATITATIAANSVALGTDTTGNYVASVANGAYITGGSAGSEGAALTLAVDATTTATASKVAARDASGDLYANIFQGTASSARYADLAERYEADAILEPGTVVCFGGTKEITACDHENDHAVAGVVSTDPAYMMNSAAGNNDTHPYIALTGRVPVKVVGPVAKGDLLVASGVKGHAMANNNAKAGTIIGKAIGSIDSGEGVVEALINLM